MKFFLIICALVAAVLAQEWKPLTAGEMLGIRNDCVENANLTAQDVASLSIFSYTEPMKGYIACFARKAGVWDDAKGFDLERAVRQFEFDLPEDKVRQIFADCISQNTKKGASPFDLIAPIQRCVELSEIGRSFKAALIKAQETVIVG